MIKKFRVKLLIFSLSITLLPIFFIAYLFLNNFNTITDVSLEQNTLSLKKLSFDYLYSVLIDHTTIISSNIESIINSVTIIGNYMQKYLDDYENNQSNLVGIEENLIKFNGAITNLRTDKNNIYIPAYLVDNAETMKEIEKTSVLNLFMGPIFEANPHMTFLYYIGNEKTAIMRGYPNIDTASYFMDEDLLNADIWEEFFPDLIPYWERIYTDEDFKKKVLKRTGSITTFNKPYIDLLSDEHIITVFYPLWNHSKNEFSGAIAADISLDSIVETILSVQITETGYALLLNSSGEIIASHENANLDLLMEEEIVERSGSDFKYLNINSTNNTSIRKIIKDITNEKHGYYSIRLGNGKKGILQFHEVLPINSEDYTLENWKFVTIIPEQDIFGRLLNTHQVIHVQNRRTTIISLLFVLITVIVVIAFSYYFSGDITSDLKLLSNAVRKISQKNYDINIQTKTKDEIGELAQTFNIMSNKIKNHTAILEEKVQERTKEVKKAIDEIKLLNANLSNENKRMSSELDVAQKLQKMVLPSDDLFNKIQNIDIAGFMEPADEVGGDYYDVFTSENSTIIGIGDVTGHGLSSGVIMLMAQSSISTAAAMGIKDLKQILMAVNSVLYHNILRMKESKSMTLSIIDYSDNEFRIVGYHESIVICRKNGEVETIDTMDLGFYIGIEDNIEKFINEIKISLNNGDVMILYTDGITEAVNQNNEEYGTNRLINSIQPNIDMDANTILDTAIDSLNKYIGNASIYDDISMIVIKKINRDLSYD